MRNELEERLHANRQRRRAERGLSLREPFIQWFMETTGEQITESDFLSVQETDALMEAVANQVKERPEDARWHGLSPLVYGGLANFAKTVGNASLYLYTDISNDAGMVLVPLAPVLSNLGRFWRAPERDLDLVFASRDAADGLWLAWQDEWVELWQWGSFRTPRHG